MVSDQSSRYEAYVSLLASSLRDDTVANANLLLPSKAVNLCQVHIHDQDKVAFAPLTIWSINTGSDD